jgi:hypothetical protein
MDDDGAEKAKAARDRRIVVICAAVGIVLPLALFWIVQAKGGR